MKCCEITHPTSAIVPILLSVPHCGTEFPSELKGEYDEELIKGPDDTDWFVDQLYSFAPTLGITMISAVWSRWVIDLNRHPESKPLYSDGRNHYRSLSADHISWQRGWAVGGPGAFITRRYGRPGKNEHALQLEMSKVSYMDDSETRFDPTRAEMMGELLYNTLSRMSDALVSMKD